MVEPDGIVLYCFAYISEQGRLVGSILRGAIHFSSPICHVIQIEV